MPQMRFDIVVVGAGSAGVAAAIGARRAAVAIGRSPTIGLVYDHPRTLGGMLTNGVCSTDILGSHWVTAPNGLFREFCDRVADHYLRNPARTRAVDRARLREGLVFEPDVAFDVLRAMLGATPDIDELPNQRLIAVSTAGGRVTGIRVRDHGGVVTDIDAEVVIDATVEGDVLGMAGDRGRDWVMGREGRTDLIGDGRVHPETARQGEPHAGEVYLDPDSLNRAGGSGRGDDLSQSFNYRVTWEANGWVPPEWPATSPPGYDRHRPYYQQHTTPPIENGRPCPPLGLPAGCWVQQTLPNDKADINLDPLNLNHGYVLADRAGREAIAVAMRDFQMGYLYFMRHERGHRTVGLSRSDYRNRWPGRPLPLEHFPAELYVREGRRMIGEYVFSEWDAHVAAGSNRPAQPPRDDFVAIGEYPMDSHCVSAYDDLRSREHGVRVCEGGFWLGRTRPYQVPYGCLVPRRLEGLLVATAVSATHVGYSTLRMEPVRMSLGQGAGVAAALAHKDGIPVRRVHVPTLQFELGTQGQATRYWEDMAGYAPDNPHRRRRHWAFHYFQLLGGRGVLHGTAHDYLVRPDDEVTLGQLIKMAVEAVGLPIDTAGGPHYSDVPPHHPFYEHIETMHNAGMLPWFSDPINAGGTVSKALFAKIMKFVVGTPYADRGGPTSFSDVPQSHWAFPYIQGLADGGYLFGEGDPPRFRPHRPTTRADAARVLAIKIRRTPA